MTIRGLLAVTQPPTHTITLNGPLKCRFDDQKSFRTKSKATPDLSPSIRPVVVVYWFTVRDHLRLLFHPPPPLGDFTFKSRS